ncbi:sugar transferase [Phyllobacterium sp. 0TCS1.6C]|uniref:sugar transferase n=1 Tax=unclassified Phyllobacterium TaxID=2638441 RepID=UPI0021135551|nr:MULTISPECIES: sugar transferase [unclassified Phyllobacterium]MCX8279952.1 sugar transferase [Phyllobacterium sp. 0TCS1.6C]MCX8296119.1 sugar transferase [Phyllobacterium sp. 0TCS1.6A]
MSYISEPLVEQRPEITNAQNKLFYDLSKRALDVAFAVVALAFLFPVLVAIVVALIAHDGTPIIYRQRRIGQNGKEFTCYKFRSMANDADERLKKLLDENPEALREWRETQKLKSDPRIHRLGRFLRVSSLDELPQFFNVLRGDMSIVGPRPIVTSEIARYGDAYHYYAALKPGITGLWQVSGRSSTGYDTRVKLDVAYFKSRSLILDIKIMCRTALVVLLARGSC